MKIVFIRLRVRQLNDTDSHVEKLCLLGVNVAGQPFPKQIGSYTQK